MTKREIPKLFEDKKIRTVWDDEEEKWYFSIVDVVGALTDSIDANAYIIRKTKRFAFFERTDYFSKTKCTSVVLPHHKIFSTGLRRYSYIQRTESGHYPNPVLFVLSLRSRFVALRVTLPRPTPCTLPRFAPSRFYRGRPGASRYSHSHPRQRNSHTHTRYRHSQTHCCTRDRPHGQWLN